MTDLVEQWMREVRRLDQALSMSWGRQELPSKVELSHQALQSPGGGKMRIVWRASCAAATVEAEQAAGAMDALIAALTTKLDQKIEEQKRSLEQLQGVRRKGLKVVQEKAN